MRNIILTFFFLVCAAPLVSVNSQTLIWTVNSKTDVLKGDSQGVSVDDAGKISPSPLISGSFDTGEQFVWSSAADKSGNAYLGTGGDGKVFKVGVNGNGSLLFDSDEINVSAIAVGNDGSVFAATSPDGKVYKITPDGKSATYFEPGAKYIWSLAIAKDGSLFVGTGETGRIYRVSAPGADPEKSLIYDSDETHIISMAVDSAGNLFAGTDSNGLVLRIGNDNKAFAVLDSPLREIHELSIGVDGSVYALALSESASAAAPDTSEKEEKDETVTVERPDPASPPVPPTPDKSRYDLSSTKSAVYRILPDGTSDVIWNSENVVGFSISADPAGDGVFVGTSDRGRIFRISNAAREILLLQTNEEQISTLLRTGDLVTATSSNKGKVFRFGAGTAAAGTYESVVLDAGSPALWGRLWTNKTANSVIETRSGNSAKPGQTWSAWNAVSGDGAILSPPSRYLQWRVKFSGAAAISDTNVSFSVANIRPEILSIEILPANVGLAANPEVVVDPNIELLGLNPGDFGLAVAPVPPRRVFQTGARSIQWKGEDRNGDRLVYKVYLRKIDGEFRQVGGPTFDDFITLDGLSIGDGKYVVRIEVSDSPSNKEGSAKTGERISEVFTIDTTPPFIELVGSAKTENGRFNATYRANEVSGHIARAEYSINNGKWMPLYASDGIVDGKSEQFVVNADVAGMNQFTITVRVFDAAGNIASTRFVQ